MKNLICKVVTIIGYVIPKQWVISKIDNYLQFNLKTVVVPKDLLDEFILMKFYDINFFAPRKYEDYLVHRFGEDWHITIKEWDYMVDDQAVE